MKKKWNIPAWMKVYEHCIVNTGGNTVEDLMNRDPNEANVITNAPVALLCVAVKSQVELLTRLYNDGLIQ